MANDNIIFIGMPAVGKSTVGVVIAKRLGYKFVDTDPGIRRKASERHYCRCWTGWLPEGRRPSECTGRGKTDDHLSWRQCGIL